MYNQALEELEKVIKIVEKLSLLNQIEYIETLKIILKSHNLEYLYIPKDISLDDLLLYVACSIVALNITLNI